ncbi:uncharacterized protein LOC113210007 [Frankliniella occidentalis]|uniref:Uncharacterized protein LOC113210007 n=1 Tax=Frankliniella occidentalis TaxID=133901 RepID=A0A9C6XSN5_FRAOC|nr:uncharacterized protein LOC113210007 [Frankliniella occidentalis]
MAGPQSKPTTQGAAAAAQGTALYSTGVACLGFVCFAVGATAVGLPLWGYFDNDGGFATERGYFGPWTVCRQLQYERERCGRNVSRFQPNGAVWASGLVAVLGVVLLALFCFLSVLQLAMVSSKDRVLLKYSVAVITKLVLALVATILAIVAASLFAVQTDGAGSGFRVSRGEAFYVQIILIALDFLLFVMSLYDVIFSRRLGGDPTMSTRDPRGDHATTFNNPGFQERANGGGISVTDASGKPYARGHTNGSMSSVITSNTTLSSNGGGSSVASIPSVTRSPLRSSLKKPRPRPAEGDGMGIQNPGFSGTSPTLNRNGSVKKVRIQTHSTAV